MKTLLQTLFFNNWQRKTISVILAIIIWFAVNHSLTTTRTLSNIPVRIINIPQGKTVEGLQSTGLMTRKITLALVGNKTLLDELTPNDLEVVIDAANQQDEWIVSITKKNLVSLNPEIDISKGITRVTHHSFIVRLTKLVTEKIPVFITEPIGEAPRDYQFLDVWPYKLVLTIRGPEGVVKRIKAKGLKLTFNLNDISKGQLDALPQKASSPDEVSFYVPDAWKQIHLPLLSDTPIEIDDPQAKSLRIDFVRCNLLPLDASLPIGIFFPLEYAKILNPETCRILPGLLIENVNGLNMITQSLYAKGISRLFMQIVKDMLQITVIAAPQSEREYLEWSVQFMNPRILEDRYVSTLMSDVSDDELRDLQPNLREEYLRNRFRSYMNRFQLFKSDQTKFELNIRLDDGNISIQEKGVKAP